MDQQTSTVEPGIPPVKNDSWGLMEAEEPGDMMSQPLWRTVTLGVIQFMVVILTVTGNMLVLIAVARTKRLQTIFNMYIVNLALTDIMVALTAMTFYSTETTLGYWPFGEFMCGVWIFFDYGMTFASVFNLLVISVDRLWSVMWSVHYHVHRTKKTTAITIAGIWLVVLFLWLPPCIVDRVRHSRPGECMWSPADNREFVVVIAVVGHHGSCVVILTCYFAVFLVLRARTRSILPSRHAPRPSHVTTSQNKLPRRAETSQDRVSADTSQFAPRQSACPPGVRSVSINVCDTRVGDVERSRLSEQVTESGSMTAELPADDLPSDDHLQSRGSDLPPRQREAGVGHPGTRDGEQLAPNSLPFSAFGLLGRREVTLHSRHFTATSSQPPTATVGNRLCDDSTNIPPDHQDLSANETSAPSSGPQKGSRGRETRAFIILTHIVAGFVVCWLPFHLVFDLTAVRPELVPDVVYSVTFWLTYVNSAINPILYNFSSSDFRRAFREMLCRT